MKEWINETIRQYRFIIIKVAVSTAFFLGLLYVSSRVPEEWKLAVYVGGSIVLVLFIFCLIKLKFNEGGE